MEFRKLYIIVMLAFQGIFLTYAQPYTKSIDVVSAGAGENSNEVYSNFGIIGQTFVSNSLSGGNYDTSVGFCGFYDKATNIPDKFSSTKILVYPNPTSNSLYIRAKLSKDFKIEIFNMLGIKVADCQFKNNIDFSTLPNGTYFMRIISTANEIIYTKKIIKK